MSSCINSLPPRAALRFDMACQQIKGKSGGYKYIFELIHKICGPRCTLGTRRVKAIPKDVLDGPKVAWPRVLLLSQPLEGGGKLTVVGNYWVRSTELITAQDEWFDRFELIWRLPDDLNLTRHRDGGGCCDLVMFVGMVFVGLPTHERWWGLGRRCGLNRRRRAGDGLEAASHVGQ